MARKFGKKNKIKLNPIHYNLGLLGESGIGKSTLAKNFCEKLVGEDGYMIFNIGLEDGIDAIDGAIYEDIPDWKAFDDITNDIINNKDTDYKDLKMIVYDTIDELFRIAEPQVVKIHNRLYPDKPVKTVNAAFGGFSKGQDKVIDIILDKIWKLKEVGVNMFIIGHTKKRTLSDPISGLEYDILTNNSSNKYFNAIKTKLHVLGIASVDREIIQNKHKNKITGKEDITGSVSKEVRKITFRDDNFNVDSKSRFANIVNNIDFNTENFIKAIEDAIKNGYSENNDVKNLEKDKEAQNKQHDKDSIENIKTVFSNDELIDQIQNAIKDATDDQKTNLKAKMSEYGISSFKDPSKLNTQHLKDLVSVFDE